MKKLYLTILNLTLFTFLTYSQVSRYEQPLKTNHIQTYERQYTPLPMNEMRQAMERRQAKYDDNKKYSDNLIDWIFQLKKESIDNELLTDLDKYYKNLRALDNQDYSQYGDYIRQIELGIKESIDKYNSRVKELNNPNKYWNAGSDDIKNENYKSAINNFTKVIQLESSISGAYLQRGYANYKLNNLLLALDDFSKFIQLEPTNPEGYKFRGEVYLDQKKYYSAISDFNKFIEYDSQNAFGYLLRGIAKDELNDIYGAMKDNQKAIELNPKFSMAYNNLGWNKFKLKKFNEALIDLNKAIELDYQNDIAYDSRAEVKFNLNDFNGCIIDADKCLLLNSKNSNSLFLKGRAQYRLGLKKEACESWSSAGEYGKKEAYSFILKYCNK